MNWIYCESDHCCVKATIDRGTAEHIDLDGNVRVFSCRIVNTSCSATGPYVVVQSEDGESVLFSSRTFPFILCDLHVI